MLPRLCRTLMLGIIAFCLGSRLSAQSAPPNLAGIVGAGTADLGQRVSMTVSQFAPILPGQLYQWRFNGADLIGANAATYVIEAVTAADVGVYSIRVSNSVGSSVASTALEVRPLAPPVITRQPFPAVVHVGQSASFSFSATGSFPRTYQWRKDGTDIPGATNSSYSIPVVGTADAAVYSVVVSNSEGSATSTGAGLAVTAAVPITISDGTPSDTSVTQGNPVTLAAVAFAGSSPFTYQWRKNGTPIPGATSSSLTFTAAALADAGKYSLVITNPAGTVTSREATLTVIPATPVTISRPPQAMTAHVGESFGFSVTHGGSSPFTYQWLKNGQPIAGAINSYYAIDVLTLADAGDYAVVITNPAGSVTSAAGHLTVDPAVLPAFTLQPTSKTVDYGDSVSFYVTVTGSQPLQFRWKKDGVVVGTSSSLDFFGATPARNGDYVLEVTNPAGTVISNTVTLTVRPPALPTIKTQPASLEIPLGSQQYKGISVEYTNTGTGPLTFQWFKNGIAIAGATSPSYGFSNVTLADAGDYALVITGPGGSVQSAIARISILPPELPSAPSWNYGSRFNNPDPPRLGDSIRLFAPAGSGSGLDGSAPFTYQWFKGGVAIPGATSWNYDIASVRDSDYATYTVSISNAAGVLGSPPITVVPPGPSWTLPWLDAAKLGTVVYFLATSPSRIERYDLAAERWLPTVTLARTPTAFLPASEGVYVAYSRSLVRLSSDLATETTLATASDTIVRVFPLGELVYYYSGGSNYPSLNRATLAAGPTARGNAFYTEMGVAPGLRKIFARDTSSSSGPWMLSVANDGTFSSTTYGSYPGNFSLGGILAGSPRVVVFPNEQFVALDGGAVLRTSDLTYVASLGAAFNDLAFWGDGTPVVLRYNTLTAFRKDAWLESTQARMSTPGLRAFVQGTNLFVFGAPTAQGTTFPVTKVGTGDFTAPPTRGTTDPATGRYSIDDAYLSADGVVHILSRSQQALLRWSTATCSFLPSIPLRGAPSLAFNQPGNSRAILYYPTGEFTALPIGQTAGTEESLGFVSPSNPITTFLDLSGKILLTLRGSNSTAEIMATLGANAQTSLLGPRSVDADLVWNGARQRLYSSYYGSLYYNFLAGQGPLPTPTPTYGSIALISTFMRFNADFSLLATSNGRVLNADLQSVGALANDIADAAWLSTGLYTVRALRGETQLQRWSPSTYLANGALTLRGTPVRIFRLNDTQVVIVTSMQGRAAFHVIDQNLNIVNGAAAPIAISTPPQAQAVNAAATATFSVNVNGSGGELSYQWARNGTILAGANSATYSVSGVQPAAAGLYSVTVANAAASTRSTPTILGVNTTTKTLGAGAEIGTNIVHPNLNVYDQVLLQGSAVTVKADADQVVRTSYLDLNDDIVQVEFAGAGSLSLVLTSASGPAVARNYNQPTVAYMKGHAGLVITGADETTNLSVFSVGRGTAVNQALFRDEVIYDGRADLAFVAIASTNGKFGGIRAGNTSFFATSGVTGIYAPGVTFTGPVIVGDINAFDEADAMLVLGSADDVRVAGGDLAQDNGHAVTVKGISRLNFAAGSTSHNVALPAQANRARLVEDGVDVTARLVPTP